MNSKSELDVSTNQFYYALFFAMQKENEIFFSPSMQPTDKTKTGVSTHTQTHRTQRKLINHSHRMLKKDKKQTRLRSVKREKYV